MKKPFSVLVVGILALALAAASGALAGPIYKPTQPIYFDDHGLIVHSSCWKPGGKQPPPNPLPKQCVDGGDTAQREGWYWSGAWALTQMGRANEIPKRKLKKLSDVVRLLQRRQDGAFFRHPTPPWNDPGDFSVDNMIPLVVAMGLWGDRAGVQRLWDSLPQDAVGKRAPNGKWLTILGGQPGKDCDAVRKRACSAPACPKPPPTPACSLPPAATLCGALKPACPRVHTPLGDVCDPACQTCEAARSAFNKLNAPIIAACRKAAPAVDAANHKKCSDEHVAVEAAKKVCEAHRQAFTAACELEKHTEWGACVTANQFSGTQLSATHVNVFNRALGRDPHIPLVDPLYPMATVGGVQGEVELQGAVASRIFEGLQDKDKSAGDELNMTLILLIGRACSPTPETAAAAQTYAAARPTTYGSFFDHYVAKYGNDFTDVRNRMKKGVADEHWDKSPDAGVSAAFGAARWYHRADSGANPLLAEMYRPVIDRYVNSPLPVVPSLKCTAWRPSGPIHPPALHR